MNNEPIIILAIETSCDETAASVVKKVGGETIVLSNVVSSQIALHAPFGGVVPDLAAREHAKNILPVLRETLREAGISKDDIAAIAVTAGPGLIPALLIGAVAGKTLAYAWKKPLLGIHHIEGHIYANFIQSTVNKEQLTENKKQGVSEIQFPLLALVVSGGHTQLVLMHEHFQYEILGETQDDAAGEAFDKVAKMLGLPYPGGPVVAKRADSHCERKEAIPSDMNQALATGIATVSASRRIPRNDIKFPRPMIHSDDFNFSFSGLKTAVLYTIKKHPEKLQDERFVDEICHEFQEAVVDVLVVKTQRAIETYRPKTFVIAGGVSANIALRSRLKELIDKQFPETIFAMPEFVYSLDNAAMIATAAAFRWDALNDTQKRSACENWKTLRADANLKLENFRTEC